jgi:hypothetical protein
MGPSKRVALIKSDREIVRAPDREPLNITPESPLEKQTLSRSGRLAHETGTLRQRIFFRCEPGGTATESDRPGRLTASGAFLCTDEFMPHGQNAWR